MGIKVTVINLDTAGGTINSSGVNTFCFYNGFLISINGDPVTPHDSDPTHNATMTTTSVCTNISGIKIVRLGDSATCGHTATAINTFTYSD